MSPDENFAPLLEPTLFACRKGKWKLSLEASFKGVLGGVLVIWSKRVVEKCKECIGEYIVACSFNNVRDGFI